MKIEILVPLDGSERAEAVLPYVVALARGRSSKIVLIRVLAPPIIPSAWSAHAAAFSQAAHDEEAMLCTAYLADRAQHIEAADIEVGTEMLNGDPARCIVERADKSPFKCMIAMTTHGHGNALHWLFGSVATKVVHAAPVPLLLIRADAPVISPSQPVAFKTILVALDGSDFAACALQEARDLAQTTGATLGLVSVLEGFPPEGSETGATGNVDRGFLPFTSSIERQALSDEVDSYLRQVARSIELQGIPVWTLLAQGKPAEAILRVSEEQHADLVVLATHGRTGLERLWLGGVAMKVVQGSARPVLLIRPESRSHHSMMWSS
jgi:nucleotide-binding universal stress UspA family protein